MFEKITRKRRGSPRAPSVIRGKVVHTDHQKRRIEIFIPSPVLLKLGWELGGKVEPLFSRKGFIKLIPSHKGVSLSKYARTSSTARVCISGDFIKSSICAPVIILEHEIINRELIFEIPMQWICVQYQQETTKTGERS